MAFARATYLLAAAAALSAVVTAHSKEDYDNMGPLGLLWPEDREWSEEDDMTAPCGTSGGVVNRTEFPIGECYRDMLQTRSFLALPLAKYDEFLICRR